MNPITGMLSNLRRSTWLAAIVSLGTIVLNASAASAQPPLGSAQSFAVLGASIVTNTGGTVVTGDLGVSPSSAITGFPPGIVVGTVHAGETIAAQAQADAGLAYLQLQAMPCAPANNLTGQVLGVQVLSLPPGVYCFDTSAQLTGTLFLTGTGPWVFQTGSTLTTASGAQVIVVDAGETCSGADAFWQVGTSATLGVGATFAGTIIAGASITVMTGVNVSGSVMALTGAVTLDSNNVTACVPPVVPVNQHPVADAGPDQVVSLASLTTLDGGASSDDGQIQTLSYAWTSNTGFSAAGKMTTLLLPLGTHVFTLTVNDGEFSASDDVTITVVDVAPPAIEIASPAANAAYALDQVVFASYTCTDASGIATCSGTTDNGAQIDTASPGSQSFCVEAVDGAGNTSSRCASYSVLEPPIITVSSPIEPIYESGSLLLAVYTCSAAATCTGDVASGIALDTSTPGLKSFTITATDAAGNVTTQLVTYTVSLGTCVTPFAGLTAWLPGEGSAIDRVSGTSGIWTGVEAYAAGKVAQGFSVGSGNSVSLPFEQVGPFTLQAWLRTPDRLLPEFTGVLSTGASGQNADSLQIELDGSGNYRLNVGDGTFSWLLGPALDFFQHVSVTFDGSTIAAYLNGQLVQSDVWTGSPGLGFHILNLGIDRDGVNPFTGVIDDVQVFGRALSDKEVAQTFLAGASGLCANRPPVAAAAATPNPAEATGPDGALVSLNGTASSDPDLDTLTCTWHEGATLLGTDCVQATLLSIGSHTISLTVDDGHGTSDAHDVIVEVRDTTGPALTLPPVVLAEATSPLGASVLYTASASDVVSGAATATCAPASGSGYAIGSTGVSCSATDAHGNTASGTFIVIVRDTTAPLVQITSPAPDAALSASSVDVLLHATDIVGVPAITVNGVAATLVSGTPQAGNWRAMVPVAPGATLQLDARAGDAGNNVSVATLLVDNDGIPSALDRSRTGGADQSAIYSNDFSNGVTAGTLTRGGWTTKLSAAPTAGAVRATISGAGTIARVSACVGVAKEVRLDVVGETADMLCNPTTGTIAVKAVSAVPQVELREQLASGAWQQFNLRTGQSMSVGSPATASRTNAAAIAVQLLQVDAAGREVIVGGYQLVPGASVDVSMFAGAPGQDLQVRFNVLQGRVPVTVGGVTRTLERGKPATMGIDRTAESILR